MSKDRFYLICYKSIYYAKIKGRMYSIKLLTKNKIK